MAKPAVINPEINYSASSTACKTDKTMSSDSSRTSCHQVNPYVEPGSCPTSLDIVREGTLRVKICAMIRSLSQDSLCDPSSAYSGKRRSGQAEIGRASCRERV